MEGIEAHVCRVVAEQLCLNRVPSSSDCLESLGADSLDKIEVLLSLEDEFSVELDESMCNGIVTVQGLIDAVRAAQCSAD